jgi:putative chitinase
MSDLINRVLPTALSVACTKGVTPGLWAQMLDPFMWQWGIKTPRKIAAFIGQVSIESAGFSCVEENLRYSADRMCQVWPSHFPAGAGGATARACEHNPEMLANVVYAERMDNGDFYSGDGWTFRGAGLIQLTGRENQTKFALYKRIVPERVGDYLRTPKGAAESACWAWSQLFDLNPMAEGWFLTSISRKINGGDEGLQARIALCNAILKRIG